MNIQIAHREYASAAENIAARKAIRQRIMSATTPPPKPKPIAINYRVLPLWRRVDITFSDHVVAWQVHLARKASSPVIGYMRRRCEEMGANIDDVVSASRKDIHLKPRQLLMWELRNVLHLSYPQIARIFDRDHATVMNSVRKIDGGVTLKTVPSYDIDAVRAGYISGASNAQVARDNRISPRTVRKLAAKHGWSRVREMK